MWHMRKPEKAVFNRCLERARQIGAAEHDPGADELIRKAHGAISRTPEGGDQTPVTSREGNPSVRIVSD
jgi:hypothetical protein